jgi:aminopeptidase-like protein
MLIAEIDVSGFRLAGSADGAVYFDYYHSAYHWEKPGFNFPLPTLFRLLYDSFKRMHISRRA